MSDFGFLKNGAEQRPEAAQVVEIFAERVAEVGYGMDVMRNVSELSHPAAARMAMGISVQPVPEQSAVVLPAGDSQEARLERARQELDRIPRSYVQVESSDYEAAA